MSKIAKIQGLFRLFVAVYVNKKQPPNGSCFLETFYFLRAETNASIWES